MAESLVDTPAHEPAPRVPRQTRHAPQRLGTAARRVLRTRRRVLAALGAGAAAAVGSGYLLWGGSDEPGRAASDRAGSPRDAGAFADRDASYVQAGGGAVDLGASGVADTPAQAAQAALAATPRFPTPLSRDPVLHLLRRATFGPTSPDVAEVRREGVDEWLRRQLSPDTVPDDAMERTLAAFPTVNMSIAEVRQHLEQGSRDAMRELGYATLARQMWSHRQLFEVMVDFWSNHLNVTNPFDGGWDNRGAYDREVIRRHAMGRYADLLLASARSPAMLRYLDNASSHRRNVNENYGRELLELHTVGIEGGYTETDVRHSAYLMTGRTVDDDGEFEYAPRRHWTGRVKVLGFTHENRSSAQGLAVGDAYLSYLAQHPATARNIARKLAVRFVCDNPPPSLVDRLAKAYLDSGTNIRPVLEVLFRSLELWVAAGLKQRRPLENFVAAARALSVQPGPDTAGAAEELYELTERLGQAPLRWGPPNGYPDVAAAWSSAHAMLGVWNSHRALVQGWHEGLSYTRPEYLAAPRPGTVGAYLDALAHRLVFQPLAPRDKAALLRFLGASETSRVASATLGGRVQHLVPLVLDSVYHALR
ncbi:MAG TPA: DUF1800 domain-containing protein [Micromonosporaceae bacterium]|nr:DUF1800 domain-containing protein [Micromonosporaceae bacterium]